MRLRISWEYLIEKLMYAVPIYEHGWYNLENKFLTGKNNQ